MREDWDDDWDDDDEIDDDDDGYVPCPYCRRPMYEESGYCAACERWISREDVPGRTLSSWQVIVILLLLTALIGGALSLF